ncbi:MAG: tRNA epoxyqueuosine(34) reductase QueG [Nitrospirae bacterium]|nr:MAG: tRNA epoxyqueuosine(34) reductase QueG [Nitrospirota bacterium]
MTLTERVKRTALDLGFQAVGVSRVTSDRPEAARLGEWLARGFHGDMGWMAKTAAKRKNPALLLHGIRAIVSLGMNYYTDDRPDDAPGHGRIARYARGEDYHRVLGARLESLAAFLKAEAPDSRSLAYVDTGAIMEKAWAQRAGLGWIGKHSNLVSGRYGSWLLLGEVLTTAELAPDEPGADLCGTCTLCIKACPTGAIAEPYVVDARRCLSYLTIERKGAVPPEIQPALGNYVFGCDDCLDVCPYNHRATPASEPAFRATSLTLNPDLDVLAGQSAEAFQEAFHGSPVRRAGHEGLRRSAAIAKKNIQRRR